VHYAAASAALRWYDVVIPGDAIFALDAFDVESSLRQTVFLFAGAHPPLTSRSAKIAFGPSPVVRDRAATHPEKFASASITTSLRAEPRPGCGS
jgi:hypothetical protein